MSKIFRTLAILAAFALLTTVSAAEYTEEEDVLVLGDNNLEDALKEFEFILVEFYAPWCGHCKKLAPEYAKAAQALKKEGSVARLAKVDATVEKKSGEKYGVKGFPTLKFFIKGEPIAYEGGRTEKDIVSWIKKKTLPSTSEAATSEDLAKAIKDNEVLVVFFGGKDHENYAAFESASKKFDDAVFFYTSNADLRTEHKVPEGTDIVLFKKFDEGRNELAGSWDAAKLTEFVDAHRFPLVLPFDQKGAQRIFGDSIPTVFLMILDNEAGQRAKAVFNEAAAKLKGKIQFAFADIKDGGLGPRLAEFLGVTSAQTPAVNIATVYFHNL